MPTNENQLKAGFERSVFYSLSALVFAAGLAIFLKNLLVGTRPLLIAIGAGVAAFSGLNAMHFAHAKNPRFAKPVLVAITWAAMYLSLPSYDLHANPLTWTIVIAVFIVLLLPVRASRWALFAYLLGYVAIVAFTHLVPDRTDGISAQVLVMSTVSILIASLAVHRFAVLTASYERLLAERVQQLRSANLEIERFKSATDDAADPTAMLNRDGNVRYVNKAWRERFGEPSGDDVRTSWAVVLGSDKFDALWQGMGEQRRGTTFMADLPAEGGAVSTEVSLTPVLKDGEIIAVVARQRPVTG